MAALGQFYGWPRAELLDLTADEVAFWQGAAAEFNERVRKANKDG